MSTAMETLDRACEAYGIAAEYTDIRGERHRVSERTKRALLAAMGIAASDDGALEAALAERRRREWRRLLPPVEVIRADAPRLTVTITVPDERADRVLAWRLVEESGREHSGELAPSDYRPASRAQVDGAAYCRYVVELPVSPEPGYHRLEACEAHADHSPAHGAAATLVVAPAVCYRPRWLDEGGRIWGVAAQLYGITSARNWGIGDFTDLATLVEAAGRLGADVVGLNPVHAMFPHAPARTSPYSPSSRLFLNVLYIDVEAVPDLGECASARDLIGGASFQERLARLRARREVDYEAVAACKLEVLELLYASFREHHLAPESVRGAAFRDYQSRGGDELARHALYEALQEHCQSEDPAAWGWPAWPEMYREPAAQAVQEFAVEHRERVELFVYLQWEAERQLEAVSRRCAEAGLSLGLYLDLALGADRAGAETWGHQASYAVGASIGAPPDDFSPGGQNWGLPPLDPAGLREDAYGAFVAALRRNMRHGGALRIDHVMALMRLFWVPPDAAADEGGYVDYPFEDLLALVALESQRNRCLVVGEDLGTVPDEVRSACRRLGILSYRLLYFERDASGDFLPPADYPRAALAAVSTHDLPTLKGFWAGRDLHLRYELGIIPSEEAREARLLERAQDRVRLLLALDRQDLLPEGVRPDAGAGVVLDDRLSSACHRYLARTPCALVMAQLEDLLGEIDQANLPGTTDEHPNWRRRLARAIEQWADAPAVHELARAIGEERGPRPHEAPQPASDVAAAAVVPAATYRLQLSAEFPFARAAALVPYLRALGITHCYVSPILAARPGSKHGYDVIDHGAISPELGGREGFERLVAVLREQDMGLVVDVVPNHMGVMGSDNAWWLDVLEHGPASRYAAYFDIDWRPVKEALRGKVLLPVLGDHYGAVLADGGLALEFDRERGELAVNYYEHRFPIDPRTYPEILAYRMEHMRERLGGDSPGAVELLSIVTAFSRLPERSETAPEARDERARETAVAKQRLASLCRDVPLAAELIEENVSLFERSAVEGDGAHLFHHLLEQQAYRLAHWRVAGDEINYRRFFDINSLAGLRMEDPQVFADTHRLLVELVREGMIEGLRVDHPDGLHDPAGYLDTLNRALRGDDVLMTAPGGEHDAAPPPVYLVAEKILASYEHLRETWPVHGTTGYEFAALVNGLGIDPDAEDAFTGIHRDFTGAARDFDELLYDCKKLMIRTALSSELTVLANMLDSIAQREAFTRDFTLNGLRDALIELVACFPVYRTYIARHGANEEDRRYVEWAIAHAKRRSAGYDLTIFDFIEAVLLQDVPEHRGGAYREECLRFAMRLQQYTAAVMPKSLEDTAFYAYNRLVSLNDVGGDPRRFAVSPAAFHHANRERLRRWPHAMLATSTHDGKRSEDMRARINVLTEMPERWRERVERWRRINRARKRAVDELEAPSEEDEYLLYQTLVGAWPCEPLDDAGLADFRERIAAYMLKATREAKTRTSWVSPHAAYEEATREFVSALLATLEDNAFLADFVPFAREVARFGAYASLSQTLLKLAAPGVPDIYQGNETMTLSLVDPDNRRAVDHARCAGMLEALERSLPAGEDVAERARELAGTVEDGSAKLYVTWRALALRGTRRKLFEHGDYLPLTCDGARADHLCAFARSLDESTVVVAAPRWFAKLAEGGGELPLDGGVWAGTRLVCAALGHRHFRNVLTGERVAVRNGGDGPFIDAAELFASFSVALLIEEAA
ncbi:MAG: malto-oligosyltrehalose synthase [Gammaproteobacteria bacterium]|nr:malto-oligosyltrehalose synthase [Gammaproteobacteria bacterium]